MRRSDPMKVRLGDLKRIASLSAISDRGLRKLIPYCRKRILPKNTVVFLEDEPAYHLYFLLNGSVSVFLNISEQRSCVYTVQAGQCFGWSALVSPYLFSSTTQCNEPCLVVEVDAVGLRKLLTKDHKLAHAFMETIARVIFQRLHETRGQLIQFISHAGAGHRIPALAVTD